MSTMPNTREQLLEATFNAALNRPALTGRTPGPDPKMVGCRIDRSLFALNLDRIRPDADQVRRMHKDQADPDVQELARSIADVGVLQPLDVRYIVDGNYYELIAGERRFNAAKLAGLTEVPVKLLEADEKQVRRLQLIENIHRVALDPLELADALRDLMDNGATIDDVATMLSKSKAYVQKALTVAKNLSEGAKAELFANPQAAPSMDHLYEVSQLPAEDQPQILQRIANEKLTRAQLRRTVAGAKKKARSEQPRKGGRPSKSKTYHRTIRVSNGGSVTVQFRRSHVSPAEAHAALLEAAQSLNPELEAA